MPGHVKRGGTGEPDPDPTPYLFVSFEQKQKDMSKVSRPKVSGTSSAAFFIRFMGRWTLLWHQLIHNLGAN